MLGATGLMRGNDFRRVGEYESWPNALIFSTNLSIMCTWSLQLKPQHFLWSSLELKAGRRFTGSEPESVPNVLPVIPHEEFVLGAV